MEFGKFIMNSDYPIVDNNKPFLKQKFGYFDFDRR